MKSTIRNQSNREYKDVIKNLAKVKELIASKESKRAIAKEINIPRSTIQNWQRTKDMVRLNAKVYEFFQTPDGFEFFNMLLIAIQFVITQVAKTGIRMVELILELTGLSEIIGSSYGTLQNKGEVMEAEINLFGQEEKARLSSGMAPKKITMAKDETFNSVTQLIAIEPVSNFIVAEVSTDKRDSESWNKAMEESLKGINAEVVQNVNDQGTAIKRYNKEHLLFANESPDLYHILHEIHKATAGPLASKASKFTKILEKLNTQRVAEIRRRESLIKKCKQSHAKKVEREIDQLNKKIERIKGELLKISNWKQTIATATSEISRNYHPYDLTTGESRTVESLSKILEFQFATIKEVVKQMNVSKKCLKRIEKAYKLVPQMLTTLRFYVNNFDEILNEQSLPLEIE